jgi:putative flippase GtrA
MPYTDREKLAQLLRFALVGGTTALIYTAGYLVLRQTGIMPTFAATLAYLMAIIVQYIGHSGYTFRRRFGDVGQIIRFLSLNGLGLVAAVTITFFLTNAFGAPDWAASVAVVVTLPALNWILMRLWVFA